MLSETTQTELKQKLEAEKNKLEAELSDIATKSPITKGKWDATYPVSDDDKSGSSGSIEEMGDEIEEYDTRISEEDALEKRLHEVRSALSAMDAGTYGTCTVCGKEIPMDRLTANPAALTDIEHASHE